MMNSYLLIVGDRVHTVHLTTQALQALLNGQGSAASYQPITEPPSAKQLGCLKFITATLGIKPPVDAFKSKEVCWQFINENQEAANAAASKGKAKTKAYKPWQG